MDTGESRKAMKPGFAYDGTESSFNLRGGVFCKGYSSVKTVRGQVSCLQ